MPTLSNSPNGQKSLANLLAQCFDIFPLYGREAVAADNIRKAFQLTLADCEVEKIEAAFRYHLRVYRDFPVPADIYQIVKRGNKPPFERSVYIRLVKRKEADPYAYNLLSREEIDYMKDYERFIITGEY